MLFADDPLEVALDEHLAACVRNSVFSILSEHGMMSRLDLKRGALAWLAPSWSPLSFGKPKLGKVTSPIKESYGLITLTCSMPINGEPQLLGFAAPIWPAARQTRGEVRGTELILTAEGYRGDETWLPAVLASELAEIMRIAAAQVPLLRCFEKARDAKVRALINRVYAQIDYEVFQDAYDKAMALGGPDDVHYRKIEPAWEKATAKLWKQWWAAGENSALA